jgi:hypothetical protein
MSPSCGPTGDGAAEDDGACFESDTIDSSEENRFVENARVSFGNVHIYQVY